MNDWDKRREEAINEDKSLYRMNKKTNFHSLWRIGIKGQDLTVAILDTGVDPVFQIRDNILIKKDFTNENNPKDREEKHGTITAKIINTFAPNAKIANFKVVPHNDEPNREAVCNAIDYCIDEYPKYKLINLSLWFKSRGCPKKCELCMKVDEAVKKGIFVTVAAGNRGPKPGTITCPGTAEEAYTVGATWSKKTGDYWEQLPWWRKLFSSFLRNYGTSFASATVAGHVALLISAFPKKTVQDIKDAIEESSYKNLSVPQLNTLAAYKILLGNSPYPSESFRYTLADLYNAHSIACDLGWNRIYQENKNPQLIVALETTLSCIDFYCVKPHRYDEALKFLEKLEPYFNSGLMPTYQKRIEEMMGYCKQEIS